jgi:hypothetical protein
MSNVLPNNDEVFLILCEDARQEIDNKLSLSGIFIGHIIVVPKGTTISNLNLLFAWFVRGSSQGQFTVGLEIEGPPGFNTVNAGQPGLATKLRDDGAVLVIGFKPLNGTINGTYKANLLLDGRKYQETFTVREAP